MDWVRNKVESRLRTEVRFSFSAIMGNLSALTLPVIRSCPFSWERIVATGSSLSCRAFSTAHPSLHALLSENFTIFSWTTLAASGVVTADEQLGKHGKSNET